jgi:hypothetical protein
VPRQGDLDDALRQKVRAESEAERSAEMMRCAERDNDELQSRAALLGQGLAEAEAAAAALRTELCCFRGETDALRALSLEDLEALVQVCGHRGTARQAGLVGARALRGSGLGWMPDTQTRGVPHSEDTSRRSCACGRERA